MQRMPEDCSPLFRDAQPPPRAGRYTPRPRDVSPAAPGDIGATRVMRQPPSQCAAFLLGSSAGCTFQAYRRSARRHQHEAHFQLSSSPAIFKSISRSRLSLLAVAAADAFLYQRSRQECHTTPLPPSAIAYPSTPPAHPARSAVTRSMQARASTAAAFSEDNSTACLSARRLASA